jgi:hypothetical protein
LYVFSTGIVGTGSPTVHGPTGVTLIDPKILYGSGKDIVYVVTPLASVKLPHCSKRLLNLTYVPEGPVTA